MIKIKNINKVYINGGISSQVLFNISFTIKKGEYVAIVGPSGSGKSTLMHILGALDKPTSGEYLLNKKDISKLTDSELATIRNKEIGFVFQSFNLLPRISALKNVILPMTYANINKQNREKTAQEMLKKVGLEDKFNYEPNKLSGGQKQRVAIARALTMSPSIILADEPTGNLPTNQSNEIIKMFEDLNKQGHTIIIITHNDEIANKTNRVITLVDGKIVSDKLKNKNANN